MERSPLNASMDVISISVPNRTAKIMREGIVMRGKLIQLCMNLPQASTLMICEISHTYNVDWILIGPSNVNIATNLTTARTF